MAAKDSEGWIVILDPNDRYMPTVKRKYDRVRFTYLHEGWTESKSAHYSSTAILGRSEPVRGYMGSSPRTINLVLSVPPEGDKLPGTSFETGFGLNSEELKQEENPETGDVIFRSEVTYQDRTYFSRKQEVLDFFRSLVHPQYGPSSSVIYPPPRVLIFFGNWFSLVGIVESYSMNHRAPWDDKSMTPHHSEISVTVSECDEPYSWNEVYDGVLSRTGFMDKSSNLNSAIQ